MVNNLDTLTNNTLASQGSGLSGAKIYGDSIFNLERRTWKNK